MAVASVLTQAEQARAGMAQMKREAQTLSGAGTRPAVQSDDEQFWGRIVEAGNRGYGP